MAIKINPESQGAPEDLGEFIRNEIFIRGPASSEQAELRISSDVPSASNKYDSAKIAFLFTGKTIQVENLHQFSGLKPDSLSNGHARYDSPAAVEQIMQRFGLADNAGGVSSIVAGNENGKISLEFVLKQAGSEGHIPLTASIEDTVFRDFSAAAGRLSQSNGEQVTPLVHASIRTELAGHTNTATVTAHDAMGAKPDVQRETVFGYDITDIKPGVISIKNPNNTTDISHPAIRISHDTRTGDATIYLKPEPGKTVEAFLQQRAHLEQALKSAGLNAGIDTAGEEAWLDYMRQPNDATKASGYGADGKVEILATHPDRFGSNPAILASEMEQRGMGITIRDASPDMVSGVLINKGIVPKHVLDAGPDAHSGSQAHGRSGDIQAQGMQQQHSGGMRLSDEQRAAQAEQQQRQLAAQRAMMEANRAAAAAPDAVVEPPQRLPVGTQHVPMAMQQNVGSQVETDEAASAARLTPAAVEAARSDSYRRALSLSEESRLLNAKREELLETAKAYADESGYRRIAAKQYEAGLATLSPQERAKFLDSTITDRVHNPEIKSIHDKLFARGTEELSPEERKILIDVPPLAVAANVEMANLDEQIQSLSKKRSALVKSMAADDGEFRRAMVQLNLRSEDGVWRFSGSDKMLDEEIVETGLRDRGIPARISSDNTLERGVPSWAKFNGDRSMTPEEFEFRITEVLAQQLSQRPAVGQLAEPPPRIPSGTPHEPMAMQRHVGSQVETDEAAHAARQQQQLAEQQAAQARAENAPAKENTPHAADGVASSASPRAAGVMHKVDRAGAYLGAATVALNAAAAAKAYHDGDADKARQYVGVAATNAAQEAALSEGGMRGAVKVAQVVAEKVGAETITNVVKAVAGKVPVVGAVVGVGFGVYEVGSELSELAQGRSNWKKVASTTASAVAGVAGGVLGFGAGEALQEGVHYGTKAAFGEKNAANHSATVELGAMAYGMATESKPKQPVRFTVDQQALAGLEKAKGWKEILDTDKDGKIEFEEVKAAFRKYNVKAAEADKTPDGKATADEIGAALNAGIARSKQQAATQRS